MLKYDPKTTLGRAPPPPELFPPLAYPNTRDPQHLAPVWVHAEGMWFAPVMTSKALPWLKTQCFSFSGQREAKISPVVSTLF